MSQITRALKKVQELRQKEQAAKDEAAVAVPAVIPAPVTEVPVAKPVQEVPVAQPVQEAPVAKPVAVASPPVKEIPVPKPPVKEIPVIEERVDDVHPKSNKMLLILAAGTVVAVLLSITALMIMMNAASKQDKVLGLQRSINIENKKINELAVLASADRKNSKSQISDMNIRLENQINDLASTNKDNYDNLKEALLDDKQQSDFLDSYTRKLDQKIKSISAAVNQLSSQAREANIPAGGN